MRKAKAFALVVLISLIGWSTTAFGFAVGSRVQANATVNVRATAAGSFLGAQAVGSQGTITTGPQTASLGGTSYSWWHVNFDTGVDGWVADIGLTLASSVTWSISPSSTSASESAGSLTFTVTRSSGSTAQTVYASTAQTEGYANSSDYVGVDNQVLSFFSGQTSKSVTVTITNDSVVEPDETFGLIVQENSSDPASIYLDKATFTIENDDAAVPDLAISAMSVSPSTGSVGTGVTISAMVANQGTGPAAQSLALFQINQNSSQATTSDPILCNFVATPAIGAGATTQIQCVSSIPSGSPTGTNYLWVTLDLDGSANQSDETNDQDKTTFTVTAADGPSITGVAPSPVVGANGKQPFYVDGLNFDCSTSMTVTLRDLRADETFTDLQRTGCGTEQIGLSVNFTIAPAQWSVEVQNADGQRSEEFGFDVIAPPSVCGNGIHESDEECDDGNPLANDCCTSSCRRSLAGASCDAPTGECTMAKCDESGQCVAQPIVGICDDERACTVNDMCVGTICTGDAVTACTDDDGCCPSRLIWGCHAGNDNDCVYTGVTPVLILPGIYGSETGAWVTQTLSTTAGTTPVAQFSKEGGWRFRRVSVNEDVGVIYDSYHQLARALNQAPEYRASPDAVWFPATNSWEGIRPDEDNVFVAAYDWRENPSPGFKKFLMQQIDEARAVTGSAQVDLVAHSMGGLVARAYIQSLEYRSDVRRLIMLGTPNRGSPDAYYSWGGGKLPPPDPNRTVVENLAFNAWLVHLLRSECGPAAIPASLPAMTCVRKELPGVGSLLPSARYVGPTPLGNSGSSLYRDNGPFVGGDHPIPYLQLLVANNDFLTELNRNFAVNRLLASGVEVAVIGGSALETLGGIRVNEPGNAMWEDGQPQFDPIGRIGFAVIPGNGDGRTNVCSLTVPGADLPRMHVPGLPHGTLPQTLSGIVLSLLTAPSFDLLERGDSEVCTLEALEPPPSSAVSLQGTQPAVGSSLLMSLTGIDEFVLTEGSGDLIVSRTVIAESYVGRAVLLSNATTLTLAIEDVPDGLYRIVLSGAEGTTARIWARISRDAIESVLPTLVQMGAEGEAVLSMCVDCGEELLTLRQVCLDEDNDAACDDFELLRGLDVGNADTDGDGIGDGAEISAGTDPDSGAAHLPLDAVISSSAQRARTATRFVTLLGAITAPEAGALDPAVQAFAAEIFIGGESLFRVQLSEGELQASDDEPMRYTAPLGDQTSANAMVSILLTGSQYDEADIEVTDLDVPMAVLAPGSIAVELTLGDVRALAQLDCSILEPESIVECATIGTCGNGDLEGDEQCDRGLIPGICEDHGLVSGTVRCTSDCQLDLTTCFLCGNSVVEPGEECDGASLGILSCEASGFAGGELACTADCRLDYQACEAAPPGVLEVICGDGRIDPGEVCDDNDQEWERGQSCSADCMERGCGDPIDPAGLLASDALYVLNAAVGNEACDTCLCNVDSSREVTATDALLILRNAVGLSVPLDCNPCP